MYGHSGTHKELCNICHTLSQFTYAFVQMLQINRDATNELLMLYKVVISLIIHEEKTKDVNV